MATARLPYVIADTRRGYPYLTRRRQTTSAIAQTPGREPTPPSAAGNNTGARTKPQVREHTQRGGSPPQAPQATPTPQRIGYDYGCTGHHKDGMAVATPRSSLFRMMAQCATTADVRAPTSIAHQPCVEWCKHIMAAYVDIQASMW